MKKTGSQIIVECLKKEGVDTLFNYPGGAVLPLFDELAS
ncbi:MAG: thiamine pyrophosphate-binding protein, partial [Deltaproteobacteria bacterium]|nr:thiamine pyrophosphate-binding protein [Deltaproteobacteria bacterium]